jgi:flagellin
MATINTNMSANIATNALTRNERSMSSTMERLSTGIRINSAKDDAAGLAISSKMTSQINGLNQAVRNANDAISMIQVAEGAMGGMTDMLQLSCVRFLMSGFGQNSGSDALLLFMSR